MMTFSKESFVLIENAQNIAKKLGLVSPVIVQVGKSEQTHSGIIIPGSLYSPDPIIAPICVVIVSPLESPKWKLDIFFDESGSARFFDISSIPETKESNPWYSSPYEDLPLAEKFIRSFCLNDCYFTGIKQGSNYDEKIFEFISLSIHKRFRITFEHHRPINLEIFNEK